MKKHFYAFTTSVVALAALLVSNANAKPLSQEQAHAAIAPLYKNFSVPQGNVADNVHTGTTSDWLSCAGEKECRGQDESIKVFSGFAKMIPDMKWAMKDLVVSGDKVVVRGELTGTPAGEFFGVPYSGKRFTIMTMDMHTIKNGKLQKTYHLEDWAGALRQLSAK
ncbi:ester cyclase [Hydromonas duriensis]|uniref:SnoaL-like polyketide cyclase n=1 Tax=Hydromonas duriensis TaxID=1527608 RepID=A0A4R6Y0R6_9BURK|nr:ester cyclase [Hydromonas duriensis]TDR27831.1 SnoaL-like polyketide cyclase [Hydromonas duriensis]